MKGWKLAEGAKQNKIDTQALPELVQNLRFKQIAQVAYKTITSFAAHATSNGATFSPANGMELGSEDGERVGRRIRMKRLRYKGYYTLSTNTAYGYGGRLRFLIVSDRANNGAAAMTYGDVMQTTLGSATDNSWNKPNIDNLSRFWVIQDRKWLIGGWRAPATVMSEPFIIDPIHTSAIFQGEVDLMGTEVVYNSGNTGTATDINTGLLGFFTVYDLSTSTITVNITWELKYDD